MGIVIRQSFWGTVIAYMGVVIGYFNTLYLRPEFLSLEEIGLFTLVTANAMMISPLCGAGMAGTWIKYFPEVRKSPSLKNEFFTFQLLVVVSLTLLILVIGYLTSDWIVAYFAEKSTEYTKYLAITAVIIIVNSLFDLLFSYCRTILSVIIPSFIRDMQLRIGAIILIGGYALHYWTFDWAVKGLAINYAAALVVLFAYLFFTHDFKLSFRFAAIDHVWKKRIFNFGGYAMLLGLSFAAMQNVSYSQISSQLGDSATGIFATCFFIGMIVEMPRRNMLKVISPIFSKAMQENDMEQVHRMYKKGSITMSIFGALLCIGILTNVEDLFIFIPKGAEFREGYWVIVAICLTKFVVMLFSFGQEIMVFSNYYKLTLYFQITSAIILIGLNVWLLPLWGITGAGISYMVAILLHTFAKYLFLRTKFNLSPFDKSQVRLIAISGLVFLLFWYLPFPFSPVPNIAIRSILTTLVFVTLIFKFDISSDISQLIKQAFEKVNIKM